MGNLCSNKEDDTLPFNPYGANFEEEFVQGGRKSSIGTKSMVDCVVSKKDFVGKTNNI